MNSRGAFLQILLEMTCCKLNPMSREPNKQTSFTVAIEVWNDQIRNELRLVLLIGFSEKKKNLHMCEKKRRFPRDKRDLPLVTSRLLHD